MAWFKIDDNFYDHPKVDDLSLEAIGLWTVCGTYAARHLTDGFIATRRVTRLGGSIELAEELVDAELWDHVDGGYLFHDWGEYQPTKGGVEAKREADRERKRKQRRNKAGQFTESQQSHTVTPSGLQAESQGLSQGLSQNGPADAEKTTLLHSTAENSGTGPHPREKSNLGSLGVELPLDHADLTPESEECHTVTPTGLRVESHRESHRPDPTRPDPTRTTSSSDADDGRLESTSEPKFSEEVTELADHLARWIVSNGNRKPRVTKTWHQAIDRLIRLDGYTPDQIRQVIDWSQSDEFWLGNILSAPTLRKQFDKLKNQMFRDSKRSRQTSTPPGSERALNALEIGQRLQAQHDQQQQQLHQREIQP